MDSSLPPVPVDLWPMVSVTKGHNILPRTLSLEIPSASTSSLLNALSIVVEVEMEGAGTWAAKPASDAIKEGLASSQEMSRHFAESAARLLSIYTAVYGLAGSPEATHPTPETVKASATRRYQIGFHLEHERQQEQGVPFNDNLPAQVKKGPQAKRSKFRR